jgi:hypothetical protein
MKPLDFEDLWDSFTEAERLALLRNLYGGSGGPDHVATWRGCQKKNWSRIPDSIKTQLLALDWEFNLGR